MELSCKNCWKLTRDQEEKFEVEDPGSRRLESSFCRVHCVSVANSLPPVRNFSRKRHCARIRELLTRPDASTIRIRLCALCPFPFEFLRELEAHRQPLSRLRDSFLPRDTTDRISSRYTLRSRNFRQHYISCNCKKLGE